MQSVAHLLGCTRNPSQQRRTQHAAWGNPAWKAPPCLTKPNVELEPLLRSLRHVGIFFEAGSGTSRELAQLGSAQINMHKKYTGKTGKVPARTCHRICVVGVQTMPCCSSCPLHIPTHYTPRPPKKHRQTPMFPVKLNLPYPPYTRAISSHSVALSKLRRSHPDYRFYPVVPGLTLFVGCPTWNRSPPVETGYARA